MSTQSDFYLNRAAAERELADASALNNVREGHLRAAAAWDLLASRSVKGDRMRAEEEKRKAAVRADQEAADASALAFEGLAGA